MTTTLVTGANGQIGSALVSLLAAQGQNVRRATSRAASAPGDVHLNLATGEGLAGALSGVDQLFLMAPPGYANQHELLIPAIDAARDAGVQKVLLLSAMGANADDSIPLRRAELHGALGPGVERDPPQLVHAELPYVLAAWHPDPGPDLPCRSATPEAALSTRGTLRRWPPGCCRRTNSSTPRTT
ncbi:MAG: NAD(P)H-binding protein [Burkholderiaceae bacterium]